MTQDSYNITSRPDNTNLYQKMVEEIRDYAIILLDTNGFIQNWNRGAQYIKQYSQEDILGKHFSIFYLQEDLDNKLPEKLLNEAVSAGRAFHEGWRKRKDGTTFWGNITITSLHDDHDSVIGFCKVTRDLTDKKIAEDNLRLSEERYHRMVAEVQDYAIILLSADGVIENWNAGAENIKGYRSKEIIGKKFEIFYTPEDRENNLPARLLQLARETGKASQEGWRLRNDGSRFWGSITITALHDKLNNIIGFSKVTRDLTKQKIAEDQLAAYTSELEIQNSELEQFAYVASHDLQEPLRKIQTFLELIRDNYNDKSFADRYFDKLDSSAKRMVELVKSLLNYSRLTKDKNEVLTGDTDLNVILAEALQDFELLIEEKNAVIECDQLPVVKGNHSQLGQLFSNLLGNSLKFSPVSPIIRIRSILLNKDQITDAPKTLTDETYYRVSVQDNGIGFEEQYSQQIFLLFQRLHGKQDYAGTGIGLALCKKIAELHSGWITAASKPGEGATFHVYLPAK